MLCAHGIDDGIEGSLALCPFPVFDLCPVGVPSPAVLYNLNLECSQAAVLLGSLYRDSLECSDEQVLRMHAEAAVLSVLYT